MRDGLIDFKFGAGRCWYDSGVLSVTGDEAVRLGGRALVTGGSTALSIVMPAVAESLNKAGVSFKEYESAGFPSEKKAALMAERSLSLGCTVIIGVGGGRAIDTAKEAAAIAGINVVTIPTTSATCAAYTPASVLYDDSGAFHRTAWHDTEVAAVIADRDILAAQPTRCLAAGMLDAMAKHIEMGGCSAESLDYIPAPAHSARFLASYIFDALSANMERALSDSKAGVHSKLLDDVSFINIAVTGMVNGMTKGRGQTKVAHPFYNGLRTLFNAEAAPFMHGEIVAVGSLAQCAYDGAEEKAAVLRASVRAAGAPLSLEELGVKASDEDIAKLGAFIAASRPMSREREANPRLKADICASLEAVRRASR